jgi:hypothetical protein
MSDGQYLRAGAAVRVLCAQCGCIGIIYSPEDCLRHYFESDYDVSSSIQNNLIVMENREVVPKRSRVYSLLFEHLSALPAQDLNCLEIACGEGDLLRGIKQAHPSWSCVGVDPSTQLPSAAESGLRFIRGFFHDVDLPENHFDVVIAHGFLNRSAILPELARINRAAKPGALISLELLELEDSQFAPYIWDHPFMYTRETLRDNFSHGGMNVAVMQDCGSARHYICRKTAPSSAPESFRAKPAAVAATLEQFHDHQRWWLEVLLNARAQRDKGRGPFYLFGAGIYNVVLGHLLDLHFITAIIDEQKAGENRWGLPVIGLEQAAKQGGTVLVCARPSYLAVMLQKLQTARLTAAVLNPAPAAERRPMPRSGAA